MAWPLSPTILSSSSARKPFITLITTTSSATDSATTPTDMPATSAMKASPLPGQR